MPKTRKKGKKRGGAVLGAAAGVLTSMALLAIFAIVIDKKPNVSEYVKLIVIMINIISAIICGRIAVNGKTQKRIISGLTAGALYSAAIILGALAISLDNISAYGVCETVLICLGGSAVGSILYLCKSDKRLRFNSTRR